MEKLTKSYYCFILSDRKNSWDEYVIKQYEKLDHAPYLSRRSDGDYFTDDWEDARNTLLLIATNLKLTIKEYKHKIIAE